MFKNVELRLDVLQVGVTWDRQGEGMNESLITPKPRHPRKDIEARESSGEVVTASCA